ncbi:Uncharacterized conserved protein UCP921964 [Methanobacterium lacus]|uniref:Uncharacterized conserved protein UCP921964 n=1 Tax=Methanobacterium lacus (strain AL-21) TaxID=877455 RepID=F0T8N8_METLA|nr:DUF2120 domain-containing protein [Methanobacterium lacus]ADZ08580.1 Uncharacterized conserved protein UCP921964 [Methanobacterium lacus]
MPTHEIAGKVMNELEAFHGSKPAIDTPQILIVRGMSRKRIDPEELSSIISGTMKGLGARTIDVFSEEATDIIGIMDENIRSTVEIPGETDVYGIYRLKESFESMNCHTEYSLGIIGKLAVFLVLWKDKSGMGPLFVELVVSNAEA